MGSGWRKRGGNESRVSQVRMRSLKVKCGERLEANVRCYGWSIRSWLSSCALNSLEEGEKLIGTHHTLGLPGSVQLAQTRTCDLTWTGTISLLGGW